MTTEGNKKPTFTTHAKATLALNRLQRQVSASSHHASTVTTSSSGSTTGLILDSGEDTYISRGSRYSQCTVFFNVFLNIIINTTD